MLCHVTTCYKLLQDVIRYATENALRMSQDVTRHPGEIQRECTQNISEHKICQIQPNSAKALPCPCPLQAAT